MTNAEKLATLNAFREKDGKAPFADWRQARHQPMLDDYAAKQDEEDDAERQRLIDEDRDLADEQADALINEANEMPDSMSQVLLNGGEENQDDEIEEMRKRQELDAAFQQVKAIASANKLPSYKTIAHYGASRVDGPVAFVHSFLNANPTLTRKQAVSALVQVHGLNYSTARTQYQKWFSKQKA